MPYGMLAEAVVLLHFGFVLFVILGGLLAFRWRRAPWFHVPAAVWGALIEFAGWTCPLTPLENWLRQRGGQTGYHGGFVEHYVLPVLYPHGLTRNLQVVFGTLVVLFNLGVYLALWNHRRPARAG